MSRAASSISSSEAASGTGPDTGSGAARPSRRGLMALGAALGTGGLLALTGCGFTPVYGGDGRTALPAEPELRGILASTQVALIPERSGQMLRRALQERLGGAGQASPAHELRVALQFGAEPEGFRRDGTPTRLRYNATASWMLVSQGSPPATLADGTERAFDAFNIPDNQFFAADASRDATLRRLVEQLADDIVLRLSAQLRVGRVG